MLVTCQECKQEKDESHFYKATNLEHFPKGRLDYCKKCLDDIIKIDKPDTYMSIFKMADLPFIEKEWQSLIEKHGTKALLKPTAIFGRYISRMNFAQYKDMRWSNSIFIPEDKKKPKIVQEGIYPPPLVNAEDDEDVADDLSFEDRAYLQAKWGTDYNWDELVKLEQFWSDMHDSYDIVSAAHKNYLRNICKCSLKMDQALDSNNVDAFNKLSKMYDTLMKSAKFTEAQNKAESNNWIDSFSEFIDYIEKDGYIEKYVTDIPKDVVDLTEKNMNAYTRKLVLGESDLGRMIEASIEKMKHEEDREEGEIDENDDYIIPESEMIYDNDFIDYTNQIEEELEEDEALDSVLKEEENEDEQEQE